jgi:hypothetical protein
MHAQSSSTRPSPLSSSPLPQRSPPAPGMLAPPVAPPAPAGPPPGRSALPPAPPAPPPPPAFGLAPPAPPALAPAVPAATWVSAVKSAAGPQALAQSARENQSIPEIGWRVMARCRAIPMPLQWLRLGAPLGPSRPRPRRPTDLPAASSSARDTPGKYDPRRPPGEFPLLTGDARSSRRGDR